MDWLGQGRSVRLRAIPRPGRVGRSGDGFGNVELTFGDHVGDNPRLKDLDAVTTARGFPQPGLDVPVLPEGGSRHVVDKHRAASALSRSFSTW